MLKHGRAGVPMEVMGLMLGEFVDDYTVRVIDVFAMPQSGTVCIFINIKIKHHLCGSAIEKAPYNIINKVYLFVFCYICSF